MTLTADAFTPGFLRPVLKLASANDGDTLVAGSHVLCFADTQDYTLNLPPIADFEGHGILVEILSQTSPFRLTLDADGTDKIAIGLQLVDTLALTAISFGSGVGGNRCLMFRPTTVVAPLLGSPTWQVMERPDFREVDRVLVQTAALGPLPAFTATGSDQTKTLTADANGALTVDGQGVGVADTGLLVGGDGVNNGVYDVIDAGDGSNPYVLKRRTDAHLATYWTNGIRLFVDSGLRHSKTVWRAQPTDDMTVIEWIWDAGELVAFDATITGSLNNYAATDAQAAATHSNLLVFTLTGATTLTGLGSPNGATPRKTIINAEGEDTLTLAHESGSSAAGNRFISPTGADFAVGPGARVDVVKDRSAGSGVGRWQILG